MTEKTADTPCTAAGRADHDLAWDSDNRKAEQAIGNHQWEREGCAACTGIARIEAEAATPSEPEAVRLLDPRLIRSIILSTGGTMDYANTVVQRLAREGYTTPCPCCIDHMQPEGSRWSMVLPSLLERCDLLLLLYPHSRVAGSDTGSYP